MKNTWREAIACGALLVVGARDASAEGEESPMIGVAGLGIESPRGAGQHSELAGLTVDLAWWHGRFGLAGEGSARWGVDGDRAALLVLGASARLQLLDRMVQSVGEPGDVELGVELQAIAERVWMADDLGQSEPAYGLGLALRFRGAGEGQNLLAESRFFLRVMSSRETPADAIARTSMPMATVDRAVTVLLGVGAAWGSGAPRYMDRFRPRLFESSAAR